jgi:hypothetical protein
MKSGEFGLNTGNAIAHLSEGLIRNLAKPNSSPLRGALYQAKGSEPFDLNYLEN